MEETYKILANRDAWSTIRGYTYQVNLSIDSWLDLKTDQSMILEHGEDIDIISRGISSGQIDEIALLQAKHRQGSLTLRSPEVIEFLINSVAHINNNPGKPIHFRYLTNTSYGKEQGSDKAPLIELWEDITRSKLTESEAQDAANHIVEFLKGIKKPGKSNSTDWDAYVSHLEALETQTAIEFLSKIHWEFNHTSHLKFQETLIQKIISLGLSTSIAEAESIYQRLFWVIYGKLSDDGLKELTSAELLEQVEHAKAKADVGEVEQLLRRMDSLESAVSENAKRIHELSTIVQTHIQSDIVRDVAFTHVPEILIDVPTRPQNLISRTEVNQAIDELLKISSCVNIHASIGTGKTLVALNYIEDSENTIWISMRDLTVESAFQQLVLALRTFFGANNKDLSNSTDLMSMLQNLPKAQVIVLDDCPRMTKSDSLYHIISSIARAFRDTEGTLFITATTPFPTEATQNPDLVDYKLPPLTAVEAGELFKTLGAPEQFWSATGAAGFNNLASKNITILIGLIRYLEQSEWVLTDEVLSKVLSNAPLNETSDEVVEELIRRIGDSEARELLYRLKSVNYFFNDDVVMDLASIEPKISDPIVRLHSLKGCWVETSSHGRYTLAPLFKRINKTLISADLSKRVNLTLGMRLLKSGTLGSNEVDESILYFIQADEYAIVGDILMKAYMSLSGDLKEENLPFFVNLWKKESLPDAIPLPLRVIIRSFQLAHTQKTDSNYGFILKSLEDLQNSLEYDFHSSLAFMMSVSVQGLYFGVKSISSASRLVKEWNERYNKLEPAEKEQLKVFDHFNAALLLWTSIYDLSLVEDVLEWLEVFGGLSDDQKKEVLEHDMAFVGAKYLVNATWLDRQGVQINHTQWEKYVEGLEKISTKAISVGFNLIWAWSTRAILVIECERLDRFDEGVSKGVDHLKLEINDSVTRFIFCDAIGKQYYRTGQHVEAGEWLSSAIGEDCNEYPEDIIESYTALSVLNKDVDYSKRIEYAVMATEICLEYIDMDGHLTARAFGTLAIAIWEVVGGAHVLEPLSSAFEALLADRNTESELWKEAFTLTGHATGFYLSIMRDGRNPDPLPNGEEYAPPEASQFTRYRENGGDFFDVNKETITYLQLFSFAEVLDNEKLKEKWYQVAKLNLESNWDKYHVATSFFMLCKAHAIQSMDYEVFIRSGLIYGQYLTVVNECRKSDDDLPSDRLEATKIIESSGRKEEGEDRAFNDTVGILALSLAFRFLGDPDQVRVSIAGVIEILKSVSDTSTIKPKWLTAISAWEVFLNSSLSAVYLRAYGQTLQRQGHEHAALIAYLASVLRADSNIQTSAYIFHYFLGWQKVIDAELWKQSTSPFFKDYWIKKASDVGFRFQNASQLKANINLLNQDDIEFTDKLLNLVFDSLGLARPN
jgi:hypothetical protein